jgi:hypothetical protein
MGPPVRLVTSSRTHYPGGAQLLDFQTNEEGTMIQQTVGVSADGNVQGKRWNFFTYPSLIPPAVRHSARSVLESLARHCGDSDARYVRKDEFGYFCWPSVKTVALDTGLTRRTVQRALAKLECELKLIHRQYRTSILGDNGTNCYWVANPQGRPFSPGAFSPEKTRRVPCRSELTPPVGPIGAPVRQARRPGGRQDVARSSTSHPPSYPQIDPSESVLNEPDAQGGSDSDRSDARQISLYISAELGSKQSQLLYGKPGTSLSPLGGTWRAIDDMKAAIQHATIDDQFDVDAVPDTTYELLLANQITPIHLYHAMLQWICAHHIENLSAWLRSPTAIAYARACKEPAWAIGRRSNRSDADEYRKETLAEMRSARQRRLGAFSSA